jgi:hypothetical protein
VISVISIVNDETIAREYLLKGLSKQNKKFELLLLDNKTSTYHSAAQANNAASQKVNGDYLMFVHQDLLMLSKSWLKEVEDWLSTLSKPGLVGIAGMLKPRFLNAFEVCCRYYLLRKLGKSSLWFHHYGRGNVLHGFNAVKWDGRFISDIVAVQTVDECLLVVPKNIFEKTKFDENTCDDWHMYGVDYALTVTHEGLRVYVLPCYPVLHRSIGHVNASYFLTLGKIAEKRKEVKVINTTCGVYPTDKKLLKLFGYQPPGTP